MKIRTVLRSLEAEKNIADESPLEREVYCAPNCAEQNDDVRGSQRLLLVAPEDFENTRSKGWVGTLLVAFKDKIPRRYVHPLPDVVLCASPFEFDELQTRFAALSQTADVLESGKGQLFEAFEQTHNLHQFVQRVYGVIGNPILVVNNEEKIVSTAGSFGSSRADLKEQFETGYVLETVRQGMLQKNLIEQARGDRTPIVSTNEYGQSWVTSIIRYKNLELGRFDVLAANKPFSEYDIELIDYAGSLAGILLDRMNDNATRTNAGASVFSDLLEGRFSSESDVSQRFTDLGFSITGAFTIVVITGYQAFTTPNFNAHIGALVSDVFPGCIWIIRQNTFTMLLHVPNKTTTEFHYYQDFDDMTCGNQYFCSLLRNNSLVAFVSEPFISILEAPANETLCRRLASMHRTVDRPVVLAWQHRLALMTSLFSDQYSLLSFLDKRILTMAEYDAEHSTDYIATLKTALHYVKDATLAAEDLNIHRNTYFYRLRKIEELFEIDVNNGDDCFAAALSIGALEEYPLLVQRHSTR